MEVSKKFYQFMDEELVRLFFSEATDLTYIFDTEGMILFVNKIFEKFTGHRPEEYYGKPFNSLFDDESLERAMDAYARSLKGESCQYELCFKDTGVFCECKNFPLKDEKGSIIGVMGIARNITARKQHEEGQRELNKFLEGRVTDNTTMLMSLNEELMKEMGVRRRLESKYKQVTGRLEKTLREVMKILAMTVESKDSYDIGHQGRVAQIACCIAEEMGLPKEQREGIHFAALLHDIGKISMPVEILRKAGPLTESEFEVVKDHPRVGYELLKGMEFPWPVAQIVLQHHERLNGSGYPYGLRDREILLEAKVLGVADVIASMTSQRFYSPSLELNTALDEITHNRGVLYDFGVVHACSSVFTEKRFKYESEFNSEEISLREVLLNV